MNGSRGSARGREPQVNFARRAIATVFFVNGATFSSWTPRLPEVQQRLDISDAALGLTLLGMGLGGLIASVISGRLVDRWGSRTTTMTTSAALSLLLPVLAFAPTAPVVFAGLLVLGAFDGLTDVAMNSQALQLERRMGRSIITRFHALWSAGAVTGGVVASRAAAAGVTLRVQLMVTAGVLVVTTVAASRWLLADRRRPHLAVDHHRQPAPARIVLVRLFLVGVAIAIAELPPHDWSALMMRDRFDLSAGAAGLGFVAVAGGMFAGRLAGDHATDRFGLERTRRSGAALAAVGIVLAATLPVALLAGGALFVAGIGLSSLFPLTFKVASELTHRSHGGMAAFSAGARLGFLCAGPVVGFVADGTSVATSLLIVAGSAAAMTAATRLPRGVAPAATPATQGVAVTPPS